MLDVVSALSAETDHGDKALNVCEDHTAVRVPGAQVIAVNQDPLGVAGDLVWKQGPNEVQILTLIALHQRLNRL